MIIRDERIREVDKPVTDGYFLTIECQGEFVWITLNTGFSVRLDKEERKQIEDAVQKEA